MQKLNSYSLLTTLLALGCLVNLTIGYKKSFQEMQMEFGQKNHENFNKENLYRKTTRPGVTVYTSQQTKPQPLKQTYQPPTQPQYNSQPYVKPQLKSIDLHQLKQAEEALQVLLSDNKFDELFQVSAKLLDQLAPIVNDEQVSVDNRRGAAIIMAYVYYSRAVGLCKASGNDIDRIIMARDEAERSKLLCDKVGFVENYCSVMRGIEKINMAEPLIEEIESDILGRAKSKKDIFKLLVKFHPDKNRFTSSEVVAWRDDITRKLTTMKDNA